MSMHVLRYRQAFDALYRRYNRRECVHPDPLEFLYAYDDPRDREIVGLVAASLAIGRVAGILRSVRLVLDRLGPRPADFLENGSDESLGRMLADFRHRFFTGADVAGLLSGIRRVRKRHGSLEACFAAAVGERDETVLPALSAFVSELTSADGANHFVPDPCRRSACKRLNLYLRWMVRSDAVDPGGWRRVSPARLIIPLDTHMHRIGLALGLTGRKQANLATAIEITGAFRRICPEDPVRYDFVLTRLGIRKDTDLEAFIATCRPL
jgi:uncharacterized protein (TIGR02757 family)